MSLDDLNDLSSTFGDRIRGVDIDVSGQGEASTGDDSVSVGINPALTGSLDLRSLKVQYGRGITQDMLDGRRPVAVVSPELVEALFDGDSAAALGSRFDVDVDGTTSVFTIVGVLERAEKDPAFGQSAAAEIFIPATAADRVRLDASWTPSFSVRSSPEEDPEVFRNDLQSYLDRKYAGNEDYEAEVFDISASLEGLTTIFRTLSTVLSAIGGISLLVGGIGVMNIMLMTVRERTREIGIRMATGARQRDILRQFLSEAVMLSMVGGLAGIALALLIGAGLMLADVAVAFALSAMLGAFSCAVLTGIVFGFMPACKASRLDPVKALTSE